MCVPAALLSKFILLVFVSIPHTSETFAEAELVFDGFYCALMTFEFDWRVVELASPLCCVMLSSGNAPT